MHYRFCNRWQEAIRFASYILKPKFVLMSRTGRGLDRTEIELLIRLADTKRHLETAFLYITKNLLICLDILFVY